MSQETLENTQEQTLEQGGEGTPQEGANQPEPNQAIIAELQQERAGHQRAQEELHALRTALLRDSAVDREPAGFDPIEAALTKAKKNMDPDAYRFMEPLARLMFEESLNQRKAIEALMTENDELKNGMHHFAQKDREREAHAKLATQIPDLKELTPKLLEFVKSRPPEQQARYVKNPELLIDIADALRGQGAPRNTAANRAKTSVDIGGAGDRAAQISASDVSSLKPGSKEFDSIRKSFYGKS